MNYLEAELEEKIRTDSEIWRFIRQGSLNGVWYWDLEDPEHEYISPEFWRLFGIDPATKEHRAAEWQDMIFPEDLELAKEKLGKHLADPDYPYDLVVRYHGADGNVVMVRCRGIAIRDETGRPLRMLGAHTDVTEISSERRKAAMARDEMETIFNAVTSGIIAFDAKGQIVRCNNVARHVLGGLSDATPFTWPASVEFLEAEDHHPLEASANPVRRVLSGHQLTSETHLLRRPGNTEQPRYVRVSSASVPNDASGIHAVLIIDDVSNEERNRQMVERKGRLDALGQLTGGIAHDFNNLLTSLLYSIVMAGRTDDPARRIENLQEAEASIDLAKSLTSRLMAFASKQPGLADSQSIELLFEGFKRLVRPMLEESVTVEFDVTEPGLIVFCELAQLESALMNLVLNSRDAILRSGKGSRITLKARAIEETGGRIDTGALQASRFVEISITDNGPGMDSETQARATDPFFTTKDTNSGTGLGLATVYGFARQSNGDLQIYSELGVGTTVQLILPRGTTAGIRELPMPATEILVGKGETILLVEDEYYILSATTKLLKDIGYDVISASSGRDALEIVADGESFDLMLTDVVMPGEVGGFDLAKEIRRHRPGVPIIYVSGYTGFTASEMGEVTAPLLQKPASPPELSQTIYTLLNNGT